MNLAVSGSRRRSLIRRPDIRLLDRIVVWATVLAVTLTGLSWFASAWWLPELLTHFRPHFAAGSLVLAVMAALRRRLFTAALAVAVGVVNGSVLLPYVASGAGAAQAMQHRVRVMAANVSYWNADYADLRETVRREDPDVLGLVEVTGTWMRELEFLKQRYPYAVVREEDGAYGLALFSRLPLQEQPNSPYIEGSFQTAISVDLQLERGPVTLLLAHLSAPMTPEKARLRNAQLRRIAEVVSSDTNAEQILVGDLNTTPWSPHYRILETDGGLVNAALGRGYIPTWPAGLGPLKIPIDHCLVSDGLNVHAFRTGPGIGSDHLPIVVDIGLPAAEAR